MLDPDQDDTTNESEAAKLLPALSYLHAEADRHRLIELAFIIGMAIEAARDAAGEEALPEFRMVH